MDEDVLREVVTWVTRGVELIGIAVILVGAGIALARFALGRVGDDGKGRIGSFRSDLGRSILLGLELLVAADIINTVAIEPTLDSVLVLGAIVLIRTFLSFSLEVEIEGRWPWQRAAAKAAIRPEPPPAPSAPLSPDV